MSCGKIGVLDPFCIRIRDSDYQHGKRIVYSSRTLVEVSRGKLRMI